MAEDTPEQINREEVLQMTTDLVSSYLSNNPMPSSEVPEFIKAIHTTMSGIATMTPEPVVKAKPAVPVSKSVTDDYLVCLEDGKKLKMLKRYLRSQYDMSPDDYRRKWNLPADYPMVAPAYSRKRSDFAKDIGLGQATTKRRKSTKAKK